MYKITKALKKDLPTCARLGRVKEFEEATKEYIGPEFMANYLDKDFFLVAKKGSQVIGYLIAEKLRGRGAIVWYLMVKKNYRAQGLGTALMKEFEARCRRHKIEWIMLDALKQAQTLHFYKKLKYCRGRELVEFLKEDPKWKF